MRRLQPRRHAANPGSADGIPVAVPATAAAHASSHRGDFDGGRSTVRKSECVGKSECAQLSTDAVKVDGYPPDQPTVRSAVVKVQRMWDDPRLWDLVSERPWLPGPTQPWMSGPDVAKKLRQTRPIDNSYRLLSLGKMHHVGPFHIGGRTNASTTACELVELNWHNVTSVSEMTNTVAHENTHYLGLGAAGDNDCDGKKSDNSFFTDGDYSDLTMPWLVSYSFGDLAQCFADKDGVKDAVLTCFEQRIDSKSGMCRPYQECCLGGRVPKNVRDIREQAGCKAIRCESVATACPQD